MRYQSPFQYIHTQLQVISRLLDFSPLLLGGSNPSHALHECCRNLFVCSMLSVILCNEQHAREFYCRFLSVG
jgi:hypothetical protein